MHWKTLQPGLKMYASNGQIAVFCRPLLVRVLLTYFVSFNLFAALSCNVYDCTCYHQWKTDFYECIFMPLCLLRLDLIFYYKLLHSMKEEKLIWKKRKTTKCNNSRKQDDISVLLAWIAKIYNLLIRPIRRIAIHFARQFWHCWLMLVAFPVYNLSKLLNICLGWMGVLMRFKLCINM